MKTQDLKEKLLEEHRSNYGYLLKYPERFTSSEFKHMQLWLSSALSQVIEATQEIKKGETKRIAYQQGYREAREEIIKIVKNQPNNSIRLKSERVRRPSMQGDLTKAIVWQNGYDDACDDILEYFKKENPCDCLWHGDKHHCEKGE